MRVAGRLHEFSTLDFQRNVANVLDCETSDIQVLTAVEGVTVYFQIADPSEEELKSPYATALTKLTGDKKMLLLYTWWLNGDSHLDNFPYDIISFVVYGPSEDGGAYIVGEESPGSASYIIHPGFSISHDNARIYVDIDITNNSPKLFIPFILFFIEIFVLLL